MNLSDVNTSDSISNGVKKIAIIGAGNVGGMTAVRILDEEIARVELVDVAENLARAKASDLEDARLALLRDYSISAGSDFSKIKGSEIVIVTAGLARRPGMTREDLLKKNAEIVKNVAGYVKQYAKDAICIIVSNPVDVMTYLFLDKLSGDRFRVFGMGMNLDASRFANLISKKLNVSVQQVKPIVIGAHGQNMIPLSRLTLVNDTPLTSLISKEEVTALEQETINRGASIVGLYGSGSAYFAPSAAILEIVKLINNDAHALLAASVKLSGEYDISDVCIGVSVHLGKGGIEEIVKLDLNDDELSALQDAASVIKSNIKSIFK